MFVPALKLSLSPIIGHKKTAKASDSDVASLPSLGVVVSPGQGRGVDFCGHQPQFIKACFAQIGGCNKISSRPEVACRRVKRIEAGVGHAAARELDVAVSSSRAGGLLRRLKDQQHLLLFIHLLLAASSSSFSFASVAARRPREAPAHTTRRLADRQPLRNRAMSERMESRSNRSESARTQADRA